MVMCSFLKHFKLRITSNLESKMIQAALEMYILDEVKKERFSTTLPKRNMKSPNSGEFLRQLIISLSKLKFWELFN